MIVILGEWEREILTHIKGRMRRGGRNDNENDRNAQNNIQEKIIQVIEELSEQMENLRHSLIF